MKKKTAIYAGSFDPLTLGHLWLIEEGTKLVEKLIIAIAYNPDKEAFFTLEERLEIVKECTKNFSNVHIHHFSEELLATYAERMNATYLLRGIRDEKDFEYEKMLAQFNSQTNEELKTILMIPPLHLSEISSSKVRDLYIHEKDWKEKLKEFVPSFVIHKLELRSS